MYKGFVRTEHTTVQFTHAAPYHLSEAMNYARLVGRRFVTSKKRGNKPVNSARNKARTRESFEESRYFTPAFVRACTHACNSTQAFESAALFH